MKKALILLFLGKAELISSDQKKKIFSVQKSFNWPSVIRLKKYVTVPYKQVLLTRKNLFRRDGYKCGYCGRSDLPLTIDHVVPRSQGGADSWMNMITACTKCNNIKGSRLPDEAGMQLLQKPYEPNHILFIKNSVSKIDENWKPYLFYH